MFRRKTGEVPASSRPMESPEAQMRIIRTHIAAQATEIGNLAQQLREISTMLAAIHDEYLGTNR